MLLSFILPLFFVVVVFSFPLFFVFISSAFGAKSRTQRPRSDLCKSGTDVLSG